MTVRRSPVGRVNLIAIPSRITWSARLSASLASRRAFMAPDEQTPVSMHSRSAPTSIFPTIVYQPHAGPKRSTHCCLQLFAFFAANMWRTIFTRDFRQEEKFIVTESGSPLFYLHSNIVGPGTPHAQSISKF